MTDHHDDFDEKDDDVPTQPTSSGDCFLDLLNEVAARTARALADINCNIDVARARLVELDHRRCANNRLLEIYRSLAEGGYQ